MKHAISVVDQLNSEIFPKLEKDQLNNILRITTDNCKKYFTNDNNEKSVANAHEDKDSGDWLTEKYLKAIILEKRVIRDLKESSINKEHL